MRIQHNIMAMSAYRNYTNNVSAMQKNLEKLSSGYKINRAGDDAAGLAISEKMRAQISGLEAASKNAKDGISLVQTAEGALTEVHDMLNRMVTLATQSANGTYADDTDRTQLQKEVNQLISEINRIADSSNFNGINLLDGSMDSSAITGATYKNVEFAEGWIPEKGDAVQATVDDEKTVLETESIAASKAGFEIDLENLSVKTQNGGDFTLKVGDKEFEVAALDAGSTNKGAAIATAIATANPTVSFDDGQTSFTVKAEGSKLIFSSDDEISTMKDLGAVTFEFEETSADAGEIDDSKAGAVALSDVDVSGTWATGPNGNSGIPTGYQHTSNTLDLDKIAAEIQEIKPGASDIKMGAGTGDYEGKLVLTAGGEVIGSADVPEAGLAATTATEFTFKATDGKTDLGKVTITAGSAKDADTIATDFGTAFAMTGLTVTGATTADAAKGADLVDALDAAGASSGNVSVKFKETTEGGDNIYEVTVGGKTIEAKGTVATGKLTLTADVEDDEGNSTTQTLLTLTSSDNTSTAADFKTALADSFDTGIAYTGVGKAEVSGTIDGGIQNVTNFNSGAASAVANTTVDFGATGVEAWEDGAKITLGDTTYTVAVGQDSVFKNAKNVIDLTDQTAGSVDAATAAKRLTAAAKDNKTFIVGHDGDGKTTLQQRLSVKDSTDMTSIDKIAKYLGVSKLEGGTDNVKNGNGLTLQIGDTAASYNQLKVDIKDCHAASLGIDGIDISTQEGASAALDKIKDAINQVSDVRGDLGATQNRLDHTINNLSVMTENIQDAESTIRDVDVAEEMMAYTKNSILIQSAQAMLAQANQVPQGVLQLLG